jgi:hypothetical protein
MINVCPNCGSYTVEKTILPHPQNPQRAFAQCPHCQFQIEFPYLPLFMVSGASGSGKSTMFQLLAQDMDEVIWLSADIFWIPEFDTPADGYARLRGFCLRTAKNVIFSARKALVMEGTIVPSQIEQHPERRYFSKLHYLALVCDDEVLQQRLKARPAWRESGGEGFIQNMQAFQAWLRSHAAHTEPPMTLFDNSNHTPKESACFVREWILTRLPDPSAKEARHA